MMETNKYFQQALANMTFEEAGGAAIRHLADLGYPVKKIQQNLYYPVPYEKVQKAVWQYFVENGTILLESPEQIKKVEKSDFVREIGPDGRASFRYIKKTIRDFSGIQWNRHRLDKRTGDSLKKLFADCIKKENDPDGKMPVYVSCRFGIEQKKSPETYQKMCSVLSDTQREYIDGLLWERQVCYHKLNTRMQEILCCLYDHGYYQGEIYVLSAGKVIEIS